MADLRGTADIELKFDLSSTKRNIKLVNAIMRNFHKEFLKWMTTDETKQKLLTRALKVIIKQIYEKYKKGTYQRTYDLLNSFRVMSTRNPQAKANIWLYSDPRIAPSKQDSTISYAAYFEKEEFNSFLLLHGDRVKPIRPFFDKLKEAFDSVITTKILDFAEKALKEIEKAIT